VIKRPEQQYRIVAFIFKWQIARIAKVSFAVQSVLCETLLGLVDMSWHRINQVDVATLRLQPHSVRTRSATHVQNFGREVHMPTHDLLGSCELELARAALQTIGFADLAIMFLEIRALCIHCRAVRGVNREVSTMSGAVINAANSASVA